ncbi:hypothetical protein [Nocardia paucivorans]|uniref:hypothetical protein n=1 Tax=Nocardia paucivorans TaxID=114259 RepID=UPI00030F09E7|nr:hypothetical protein [Nocardia paucivorans]
MAGRRRGWFRAGEDPWLEQARGALATAFLDMDRRQSAAEAAVHAAEQIFPDEGLSPHWESVRTRCYAASEAYVGLTGELDRAASTGARVPDGQVRVDAVVRQLTEASRGIDQFYYGNRARLDEAVAVLGAVPGLVEQVKRAAAAVRRQAAESEYAGYPSVSRAAAAVDEAVITLDGLDPHSPGARRAAANHLDAMTKQLAEALAQAPSRASAARNAVASAGTRLAAVRTRAERLGPAYSALLREFNAASSADLTNNERASERHITAAEEALTGARVAEAENNPELSLELITTARGHLADAERLVDAVTERLTLLRTVRENPRERAEAVRFRLRDAQMLAVDRGLVDEWGSVLDAQVQRLDRIADSLTGRHPDYWAYVRELDTVAEFVAGVVDRMRKQSGQR